MAGHIVYGTLFLDIQQKNKILFFLLCLMERILGKTWGIYIYILCGTYNIKQLISRSYKINIKQSVQARTATNILPVLFHVFFLV